MLLYEQITSMDKESLKKEIDNFFVEDMPTNDLTTDLLIDQKHKSKVVLKSREPMIFCGSDIIETAFTDNININCVADGSQLERNSIISTIKGNTKEILIKQMQHGRNPKEK